MLPALLTLLGTVAALTSGPNATLAVNTQGTLGTLTVKDDAQVRWSVTTQGLACITSTSFSPDGHFLLAVADGCGYVQLWDARSGKRLHTYLAPQDRLLAAAFTPDSRRFLLNYIPGENHTGFDTRSGFTWPWNESSLWSVQTGKRVAVMTGSAGASIYLKNVSFSGDGRRMVVTDGEGPASVWNAVNGAFIRTLPRLGGRGATKASLNQDGSRGTVTFVDGVTATFDMKTGALKSRTSP